jgi:ubiquinone/menaquinone biosynthesis C-methylase UbiE
MQEWINRFQKTWQGLVDDLLNSKSLVGKLIDIGAGTGGFLLSFHQSSPQTKIFAVESSAQAREHLLTKLDVLEFPVNSAEELHVINDTFDAVVLLQCLEHVNYPLLLCKQIFRILNEDGVLLLTVPNRFSVDAFFKNKKITRCYGNQTHLQFFSNVTLIAMLKKAGFTKMKRISRYGGSEASSIKGILQYILRKLCLSSELRYIIKK